MKTKDYIKMNIEIMIKEGLESVGYIRGYIAACGEMKFIEKETIEELKGCLKEKYTKEGEKVR